MRDRVFISAGCQYIISGIMVLHMGNYIGFGKMTAYAAKYLVRSPENKRIEQVELQIHDSTILFEV